MNQIRARVQPCKSHRGQWTTSVNFPGAPFGKVICAPSWPEAMQAAYKLIQDLDRELMDQVHESRASRRAAPTPDPICTVCGKDVPAGDLHIDIGHGLCIIESDAVHTQEPTA